MPDPFQIVYLAPRNTTRGTRHVMSCLVSCTERAYRHEQDTQMLRGRPRDVCIFQIAQNLTMSSTMQVIQSEGEKPESILWLVIVVVEISTTTDFEGITVSQTAINLNAGTNVNERFLAHTAVTLAPVPSSRRNT